MVRVRPAPSEPRGRIEWLEVRSALLRGNPWDDPHERRLPVYLPAAYADDGPPFLVLWDLAAFTNTGPGHLNWRHRGETLVERMDRLIGTGAMPPVVVPMPDAFTSLGGNQYLDSPAVGAYQSHLNDELLPLVEDHFNVLDTREGRGAFGTSSGGYGALVQAMLRPANWGGLACHAGDMGFEWVYRSAFPVAARVLARHGGDARAFLEYFWSTRKPSGDDYTALMTVAMAASYDPDPDEPARIRLPFDVQHCEVDEERWAAWSRWDPVCMAPGHLDALRGLHALWLDVGQADEYHLQFGARRLHAVLEGAGVGHHYEEFEGGHRGLDWRLDHSLPFLARRLLKAARAAGHDVRQ